MAPKPGVIPLRPIGLGEILDGAFTSVRRNPKATIGLAAIVMLISGLISGGAYALAFNDLHGMNLQTGQHITGAQFRHIFSVLLPTYGITILLTFLMAELLTGMLTAVIGRGVLGQRMDIGAAWRTALPRLPAIVGSACLYVLSILGIWVVYAVLGLIVVVASAPAGLLVGYFVIFGIAAVCGSVWLGISFSLALPTVVLERQGPARSLARSFRLVRGSWWRVFGITLLVLVIVIVASLILQIPFNLIGNAAGGGAGFTAFAHPGSVSVLGVIITSIGGIVVAAVTRPIEAGVSVLLYVDLRMRKEGLDLALQTAARNEFSEGEEFVAAWRPPSASTPGPGSSMGGLPPAGPYGGTPPPAGPYGSPPQW
jgi:hypothetical protein